jgi:hypothetical protein
MEKSLNILGRTNPLLGNVRNTHAVNNTGEVFSAWFASCVLLGNGSIDTCSDSRRGVLYVVCWAAGCVIRAATMEGTQFEV